MHREWGCLNHLWTPGLMVSPYVFSFSKEAAFPVWEINLNAYRTPEQPRPLYKTKRVMWKLPTLLELRENFIPTISSKNNQIPPNMLWCPLAFIDFINSFQVKQVICMYRALQYVLSWPTSVLLHRLLTNYGWSGVQGINYSVCDDICKDCRCMKWCSVTQWSQAKTAGHATAAEWGKPTNAVT